MKISFFGAAGEVTGSCTLVETDRARVLVDFGLHQGRAEEEAHNRLVPPIDAPRLDAVVLTHAHMDHAGRMPMLPRLGYTRKVWATPATIDLSDIMLRDSANLQESEAERQARHMVRGAPEDGVPPPPLYTEADVQRFLPMLAPLEFGAVREIAPGVEIRLVNSGHILGAASVEMTVREGGAEKVVAFSGDVGPRGLPLLRDAERLTRADVVVLESTYGDRDHRSLADTVAEFEGIVKRAVWDKEKVLMPAFAVGRSQQLLFHLGELGMRGRVPRFPAYLDSPMAIRATEVYGRHGEEVEAAARAVIAFLRGPGAVPEVRFTCTSEESRAINSLEGAAVIIAASGMCTGGRILHHLRHHLWKRGVHVVIAGYQAAGSLGRRLVDGAPSVRIMGQTVPVRAEVHTLGGFSAHAGQADLLWWLEPLMAGGPRVALNHGEDRQRGALSKKIAERWGAEPATPEYGDAIEA